MTTTGLFVSRDDGEADGAVKQEDNATRQATEAEVNQIVKWGEDDAARSDAASCSPSLTKRNNSIGEERKPWQVVSPYHRRVALVMEMEIQALAEKFGVDRLGVVCLTFQEEVTDKEANKRFNSLRTNVLSKRYERGVFSCEHQKRGTMHFHGVVVMPGDIKTGAVFEERFGKWAVKRGTANALLRSEWAFWRKTCKKYGFGGGKGSELDTGMNLLPVRTNAQAVSRYLSKYFTKGIENRKEWAKGARLVRYMGYRKGQRRCSMKFGYNTTGSWVYRHKLKWYCHGRGIPNYEMLPERLGRRWAYNHKADIAATVIREAFLSLEHLELAQRWEAPFVQARMDARKLWEKRSGRLWEYEIDPTVVWSPKLRDGEQNETASLQL
jgi:hypothetical protein